MDWEQFVSTKNNNKTEDSGERESEQDISHETKPTNTSNSQENTKNNDTKRENQEISPEKNITQISSQKHISHDARANNSKRSRNKVAV